MRARCAGEIAKYLAGLTGRTGLDPKPYAQPAKPTPWELAGPEQNTVSEAEKESAEQRQLLMAVVEIGCLALLYWLYQKFAGK